ncbi:hypothetical protein [Aliiglaciecola litoralis]|uniref:Uncharacterized protein n=1 Tax=Aliiglaciecola litoralis TaxID=582857 RepID=A0ABP3WSG1_9ALTE
MSCEEIILDVRNRHSPKGSGYKNTTALHSKQPYSYRFTGGVDGAGGIEEIVGSGPVAIPVVIKADARYRIAKCLFTNNSVTADLSWTFVEGAAIDHNKSIVILDTGANVMSGEYTIKVIDIVDNHFIMCDPPIRNRT